MTYQKSKKPRIVQKYLKSKIIRKYDKLIEKTIESMKDCSMGELWCELDKLKQQMTIDFEKAGIVLES